MIRLMAMVAVGAALFVGGVVLAQPASKRGSDAIDPCAAAGDARFKSADKSRCEGFWNIYASIPQGDVWWFDNKNGDDPKAAAIQNAIDRKAALVQQKLKRCGITTYVSLSDWFDHFAGDLVVVHSNPQASHGKADAELTKAKGCGVSGYSIFSTYQFAGQD